ncbi:MAG: hypothetical protein HKN09_07155 [Saprospiraceae bacterium]|nr:hypothetical protein [Saprospiraceae bacterium]
MIPNPQSIHKIGQSLKTHGKEGYLRIDIEAHYLKDLSNARAIFIDLEGSRVPFLIEDVKIKNQVLVKLDAVNDPESANPLQLKSIFLHESDLSEVPKVISSQVEMLVGFQLKDQNDQDKGQIESLEEYPHQLMAMIMQGDRSFLLPIHEEMIMDINPKEKWLQLKWPQGIEDV